VRDDPHQVMERDAIAGLHPARHGLVANAGVADLFFRILRIDPEDVKRDLTVDRDRLDPFDDGGPRALEHMAPRIIL
jgi:hypothetical protein